MSRYTRHDKNKEELDCRIESDNDRAKVASDSPADPEGAGVPAG